MSVHYDHLINYQVDRPKFIDGATYASAINEALANEGKAPRYDANAMSAFQSGQYPYQYPSVNWVDETFRHHGVTNKVGIDFTGGGERFRYYTALNLLSDKGFIKSPNETEGYSTQDKYVRGNMRVNLDIDLTPTTMLKVNMAGILSEVSQPGNQANLWSNIYDLPSAAFPIKSEEDDWGGNSTWAGTLNPVALSTDAAYYKTHERGLFSDITLTQDLSSWTKGLGFFLRLGYDTYSTLYEDHSKTYVYGSYPADENELVNALKSKVVDYAKDEGLNKSIGIHLLAGVRFKLPIIPIAAYANVKCYLGGDYDSDIDAGNFAFEIGGGFAL